MQYADGLEFLPTKIGEPAFHVRVRGADIVVDVLMSTDATGGSVPAYGQVA